MGENRYCSDLDRKWGWLRGDPGLPPEWLTLVGRLFSTGRERRPWRLVRGRENEEVYGSSCFLLYAVTKFN